MTIPARTQGSVQVQASQSYAARQLLLPVQRFIHTESTSGIALLAAAVIALLWVNSAWGASYDSFWNAMASIRIGPFSLAHTVREWVNDALMAVFFFVVGLEVKREFVHGELSALRRASLPIAAAIGGMLVPAALYAALNVGSTTARGWGVPMATDIAFAVGVLALLGNRIPTSLRVFLLALATVDDIGAILMIALFYTDTIAIVPVLTAAFLLLAMLGMRHLGVYEIKYYIPFAVLFWFAILQSGIHATIAGVALGLMTPTRPLLGRSKYVRITQSLLRDLNQAERTRARDHADAFLGAIEQLTSNTEAPADRLLRTLHGWSSFVVLPIFALANAGVVLTPAALWAAQTSREGAGIIIGLGLGKLLGISLFSYAAVKVGFAALPLHVTWTQIAGIGLLGGIGFTVSLFISDLAFNDPVSVANAKTAILLISVVSGALGYLVLRTTSKRAEHPPR